MRIVPDTPIGVYQFSQALRYVVSLLVSVVIARSSLPVEVIGQYELLIFVIASLSTFWSAGIKTALLSRFASLRDDQRNAEIRSAFFLLTLLSSLAAILILLFSGNIFQWLTGNTNMPFTPVVSGILFFSVPCLLTENILYLNGRLPQLFKYASWSHGGLLLFIVAAAVVAPSLNSFLWVLLTWNVVKFIYLLFSVIPTPYVLPSANSLRHLLLFSSPLILQSFLGQCMDLTDGMLVSHYFSQTDFAIFRYGARELPFAALVFSSLSAACIPLYQSDPATLQPLKEKATFWMHRFFIPAMFLAVLSPFLFTTIYGKAFLSSAMVFNIYLLIIISRVLLPQVVNLALHQHRILVLAAVAEICINLFLSLWWLRIWGLSGLIAATVVAYACEKIILITYNYRINHISPASYIDLKWYFLYSGVFLFITALIFIWHP